MRYRVLLLLWLQVPALVLADPVVRIDQDGPEQIRRLARPIFQGIAHVELAAETPRRMRGQALLIDLQAPGLSFFVNPPSEKAPEKFESITTSNFLKKYRLQAAINAAPFHPVVKEEGVLQEVIGLAVSRGKLVSKPQKGYAALLLTADNKARIVEQPPDSLQGIENACGGFKQILREGKNIGPDDALHPRSAVGISRDGRTLILLVIDGRQKNHSLGAKQSETADWLVRLGAYCGLNLDGGGSSSLVIAESPTMVRILNRPIQSGVPGRERPCPNHLGIYARPLPR
jgi:hypothetical protein